MSEAEKEIVRNEILSEVNELLVNQTAKGLEKYGHGVNPDLLSVEQWLTHKQEEMLDGLIYTTIAKKKVAAALENLKKLYEIFEREQNRGEHTAYKSKFDEGYAHAMKLARNLLKEDIQKLEGENNG